MTVRLIVVVVVVREERKVHVTAMCWHIVELLAKASVRD
jgi:hypothetical protein